VTWLVMMIKTHTHAKLKQNFTNKFDVKDRGNDKVMVGLEGGAAEAVLKRHIMPPSTTPRICKVNPPQA
jgi:hypothetical protein